MLDAAPPTEPVVVPVVIISRLSGIMGTRRGLTGGGVFVGPFASLCVQVVVGSVVIGGDAGLDDLKRLHAIEDDAVVVGPLDDLDIGDQARRQGLFQLIGTRDPEFQQLPLRHTQRLASGKHRSLEGSSMSAFRDQTESYNSPTDVARLLGKHPNSVIRWIMQGALLSTGQKLRLQAVRSPGGWLIQKSWVDAFLADLTADRQRPDVPAEAPTTPKTKRIGRLKSKLTEAGF